MYSPHVQSLVIQTHIDDLRREAASRRYAAVTSDRDIRRSTAPLFGSLKRALERLGGHVASGTTAPAS